MCASSSRKRRSAPAQQQVTSTQSNTITSLLDAYDFLATNDYSEKTIGIQAFLTRKSVGDINFSEIVDDSEKRSRPGQPIDFARVLEDKRTALPDIEASIEKCLMLTRLTQWIKENAPRFTKLMSDIRLDMQFKMIDDHIATNPYDLRQHELEFNKRNNAQQMRRLYYHSDAELGNPKNLVYLQNRTTELLNSMIRGTPRDSKTRQLFQNELETIFRSSFLIVAQPHSGVIPVTIYERKGPGQYTAKISVTIICLLYDFMQQNPDIIELYDIEPSLCPSSDLYKLEEPRSLAWKYCQLQTSGGSKTRTFLCAELSYITIAQSSKTDTRVRFAQALHSFKFAIKLQLKIADSKLTPVFQFSLESLLFGIGAHNSQIPQMLTRVMFEDIKAFSRNQPITVGTIQYFIERYFIHRSGVQPNECVKIFLGQQLSVAKEKRNNFQLIEDIYLDFLVNFVHQVEFMAKHPVLAMFHADGLFLGICDSERAADAMVQSSVSSSPIIELRFNMIRVDYNAINASASAGRSVRLPSCAIRVDIYNDHTKKIQNRTLDSLKLTNEIGKFVSSAEMEHAGRIRILSNFDDVSNMKKYSSFREFMKYFHERLVDILKDDVKYKLVTDLVDNANDGNTDDDPTDSSSQHAYELFSPNSMPSWSPLPSSIIEADYSSDAHSTHDHGSFVYDNPINVTSPRRASLSSNGQQPQQMPYVNDQEAILKELLSRPEIAEQVIRHYGISAPQGPVSPQQLSYPAQPLPSHQQILVQYPSQVTFQQPAYQTLPSQQQPSMQFQQPVIQQQIPVPLQQQQQSQMYFHQPIAQPEQRPSSSVIHYYPNNMNPPSFSPQQIEDFQLITPEGIENVTQQFIQQIDILNLSDGNITQSTAHPIQLQPVDEKLQMIDNDPAFQRILQDLKK